MLYIHEAKLISWRGASKPEHAIPLDLDDVVACSSSAQSLSGPTANKLSAKLHQMVFKKSVSAIIRVMATNASFQQ
ncbi:Uncharacterized protein APZ42_012410 [Daphnia magna]|uniref:Uncharacterized protein n=1 Tax=Daphnia magna TaxID=35525 RepID=A0A162RRW9_9CRUS|nr:Uncharacterized protein APZ42_012410 [Daphnia magna]